MYRLLNEHEIDAVSGGNRTAPPPRAPAPSVRQNANGGRGGDGIGVGLLNGNLSGNSANVALFNAGNQRSTGGSGNGATYGGGNGGNGGINLNV